MTTDPCVLAAAVAAARDLAAEFPGAVAARVVGDAEPWPVPRSVVEVIVDAEGVFLVATGQERTQQLYLVHVPLPRSASPLAVKGLRAVLLWHAEYSMHLVARQLSPAAARLFRP